MARIYTKTGDKGRTRLVCGSSVSKSDPRIETYGTLDELNSVLGLCITSLEKHGSLFNHLNSELTQIQNELFNLGSLLACEDSDVAKKLTNISPNSVQRIENSIDSMTKELPELRNFILPGGSEASSFLHLARTICRRGERQCVRFCETHPENLKHIEYINRLSDYLFVASRFVNLKIGKPDVIWNPNS